VGEHSSGMGGETGRLRRERIAHLPLMSIRNAGMYGRANLLREELSPAGGCSGVFEGAKRGESPSSPSPPIYFLATDEPSIRAMPVCYPWIRHPSNQSPNVQLFAECIHLPGWREPIGTPARFHFVHVLFDRIPRYAMISRRPFNRTICPPENLQAFQPSDACERIAICQGRVTALGG
jgi:hypothetical protein